MTDIQLLALGAPIALFVLVAAIVGFEELFNQAEMKREAAANRLAASTKSAGSMTVDIFHGDFAQISRDGESSTRRRAI